MLVQELIRSALRKIGAIATSETPTSDEANDALSTLNDMLSSWQNERLTVRSLTLVSFPGVASQPLYTLGIGGTVNLTYYPIEVDSGYFSSSGYDLAMRKLTQDEYDNFAVKGVGGGYSYGFYAQNEYPLIRVYLYPAPGAGMTINLRVWKPIPQFSSLQEVIALPPGWQRALTYNLAKELAPEYGQEVTQTINLIATESKANIKRVNASDLRMVSDDGLLMIGANKQGDGLLTLLRGS